MEDLLKIEIVKINSINIFIDIGKIVGYLGKKPPLLQNRKEFKLEEAREIWKKLIAQGWRRTNLFNLYAQFRSKDFIQATSIAPLLSLKH